MSDSNRTVNGETKRVVPAKFAHAVLRTNKFDEMVKWYTTVLQAEIVHATSRLAFMTYDDEHHRLAIAAFPGLVDRAPRSVGLDHLAYTYQRIEDLLFTYERLKAAGILPGITINHGVTTSFYYRDPDGNRVELQIDNFSTVEELKAFFRSDAMKDNPIGVNIDPEHLVRRHREGASFAELTHYDAAKGLDPSMMARFAD